MKRRLFDIVNGEPVITAPLVNLSAFKKVWDEDKTDDKSVYKKWMLYIYYVSDYRSDFYELEDKEKQALKEVFGRADYKIPKKVDACIEEYITRNTPAEQRSLDGAIKSADAITATLNEFQQNNKQNQKVIEALEGEVDKALKAGESLLAAEYMTQKIDIQTKQLDVLKKAADMIPKIEKNIESIVNLRRRVEEALDKVYDSREVLENFIIDEFINKKELGLYSNSNG
jgi:hypothetical protein